MWGCVCLLNVKTWSAGAWEIWSEPIPLLGQSMGAARGALGSARHCQWMALNGAESWHGFVSVTRWVPVAYTKGLRLWKVVKKRSFPLCTLFLTALPMTTTSMETNGSCLQAQEQGTEQWENTFGAYFYLILFSHVCKKALSILCFANTLMDKCRTIQRESASGDMVLRMVESICPHLSAEWKDYRINQCLPSSGGCFSLVAYLPCQFLRLLSFALSFKWSFL